jgi:hypothetical protein
VPWLIDEGYFWHSCKRATSPRIVTIWPLRLPGGALRPRDSSMVGEFADLARGLRPDSTAASHRWMAFFRMENTQRSKGLAAVCDRRTCLPGDGAPKPCSCNRRTSPGNRRIRWTDINLMILGHVLDARNFSQLCDAIRRSGPRHNSDRIQHLGGFES